MKEAYADIQDRLGPPLWWDEAGVPRYVPFAPDKTNNVYAERAALLLIVCQGCAQTFPVASVAARDRRWLETRTFNPPLDYGDPPFHGAHGSGQCSGTTMVSETAAVLERWVRNPTGGWGRVDCFPEEDPPKDEGS
jgi:hypothetical protein